jgi:hypothetical protein
MDPYEAAAALGQLRTQQERFIAARQDRQAAILACVRASVPLRDVAQAASCSHETVRRIVAADGSVAVSLKDNTFVLPGQTIDVLLYKLAGYGQGNFAPDLSKLQAGTEWLAGAATVARELVAAKADEAAGPVVLNDFRAFALHQVLRLTAMDRPSVLYDLADDLRERYGYPPYRASDLKRWTTPER